MTRMKPRPTAEDEGQEVEDPRRLTEDEERELEDLYQSTYSEAYQEAFEAPLKYLHHDTDAHADNELRVLAAEVGSLEIVGQYWCLMELLAQRKGHVYDVSRDHGWQFLAIDMSTCGVHMTADQCREVVGRLAEFNKINAESFAEGHIVSDRISRQADRYADKFASAKAGGAKSARKRQMLKERDG